MYHVSKLVRKNKKLDTLGEFYDVRIFPCSGSYLEAGIILPGQMNKCQRNIENASGNVGLASGIANLWTAGTAMYDAAPQRTENRTYVPSCSS